MTTKYFIKTPLSLLALTLFSGILLMSSSTSAEDIVDEINITVPVSCSLSGTGMASHTATIENGRYVSDIGTTTLKAFCNDTNGFAIYAIGFTDNEYGKTVLTNSTLGTSADIATGTATSGSTSNWAMKLATNTSATYALTLDNGFGSYSSVPASYTKVAHRDSGTDIGTGATGASLTSTYAAFMSQTQPAGTYTGQVKYTLVHPSSETPAQPMDCETGKICYYPNSGLVVGQMGKQTPTSTEVTLWAPNYKRVGYGFAGWNTEFDYSGYTFGPNQTVSIPTDGSITSLSLYAIWIESAGILQGWNGCSGMNTGDVTALTDNRDNNTYAVAKLVDGKCWMIENLRLADKDSNNNDINLSSSNTHNPSLPLTNSWWYSSANDNDTAPTSNHLSPTTNPFQTLWCQTKSSACIDQSMLATNNTTLYTNNTSTNYSASSDVYSYGNYYNWYSATAGHGKYDDNYGGYHSPGDICPAGWRLPMKGDNSSTGDYLSLDIALGGNGGDSNISNLYRSYPNNFVLSGAYNAEAPTEDRNSEGIYWTNSTGLSGPSIFYLHSNGNMFWIADNFDGASVRCIAGV
ncbi:hypothetical protein IKF87_02205 [Candidatus Saccharibacteria bacterium]|nr:hypothetical protein [Candidatus Saccharibacteria bacterium]